MELWNKIIEICFPEICTLCQKPGALWCDRCREAIVYKEQQECFECYTYDPQGKLCTLCKSKVTSPLDFLYVSASYRNGGTIARLIQKIKYKAFTKLLHQLPKRLFQCLTHGIENEDVALVPVPLHPMREKERGFNQAYLLSQKICSIFPQCTIWPVVIRMRYTKQQAKLSKTDRLQNVQGAFQYCGNEKSLDAHRIYLIVDDVASTRSTMEEVARVLRAAGAQRVGGFVLARH